jgi:hypothetical protein
VLVLLPVPAAEAFHDDGELVITGSSTASVTLTMPERSELIFDPFFDEVPVITGGRDLAGIVVTDAAGEIVLYDVVARVANDAGLPRGTLPQPGPDKVRMSDAGDAWTHFFDKKRYTITLLADAPVTVKIGVRGMRGRTLRPSTPVAVKTYRPLALPTAAQPRGEARSPVSLRRGSTVLLYTDHAATGLDDAVQWLCVTDPGDACDDQADAHSRRQYGWWCIIPCVYLRNTEWSGFHWVLRPRRTGNADAVARSSMPYGVTTDVRAFFLVLG